MTPAKPAKTAQSIVPLFRELTRAECDALLERNDVGRVAFSFHDHVDIEPVNYIYANGWLHGRTAPGAKIHVLRHHPWVAFEVDEVDGLFDWRSVTIHGVVHVPDPEGSPDDQAAHADTLERLRELIPETLTKDDPAPRRLLLFRIHVDNVSGRAASTQQSAPARRSAPRRR